ncbi:MAG: S1 RNA-binding domain-containing protein, partial [Candidatus Limnocylindrales bacterium]
MTEESLEGETPAAEADMTAAADAAPEATMPTEDAVTETAAPVDAASADAEAVVADRADPAQVPADDAEAAVATAETSPDDAIETAEAVADAPPIVDEATSTEAVPDAITESESADTPTAIDGDADAEAQADGAAGEDASGASDEDGFDDAPPAVDEQIEEAVAAESPVIVRDDRPEPTTMEELLSEQTDEIRSLKHGDVVEGQVVRIDKDEILVDIGAKSEGVVSNRELYGRNTETQPQLNIGDTVLVYVLQPESNEGHAVLSLRRAGLERKWRAMQEQLDAGTIIEAPVIDHNKGGLIVDCGIRGFVPISQIVDFPRRPQNEQPRDAAQEIAEKLQPYVGRKLRLKILEVNRKA